MKRLLVCLGHYPSPYKPYYDTQLIDLMRSGYDVRIAASRPLDATLNDKVRANGLLDRTRYYPLEIRSARPSTAAKLLLHPIASARCVLGTNGQSWRRKTGDLLRMLALPEQRPHGIVVHELGVALTLSWLRRWYPDVPMAMYYHGGEVASVEPHGGDAVTRIFDVFDVVFTNTAVSARQLIARGCPPGKIRTLPVGFDLEDYQPPAHRGYRAGGTLQLLSLGRMSEEKGLDDALQALRLVIDSGRPNVHLSLAGDGYLRGALEAQVRELELNEHVSFLGTLSTRQVADALSRTDALVLSSYARSNWTETQACAVQEAMLMKAVVITTQTGGVPESIPEVMKPFSVPERDTQALARAIETVHDLTATELAALGEQGRAWVAERYDIRTINQTMLTELWAC